MDFTLISNDPRGLVRAAQRNAEKGEKEVAIYMIGLGMFVLSRKPNNAAQFIHLIYVANFERN